MAPAFHVLFFMIALTVRANAAEISSADNALVTLYRQVIQQQLLYQELIRSDGDSGVKQVRTAHHGTRKHTSHNGLLPIHEHANDIRTVGLGEFNVVLDGLQFRTRQMNDYRLDMASRTSKDYHATEEIPFPEVPPEVRNKTTVDAQIVEMREWFKAFKYQNTSHRDYRPYFKPVLCYLEGAWTTATKDNIEEQFESDRHFTDAESWLDLQEKIRFTSYTGRKNLLENFSYLPTTVIDFIDDTIPVLAQWNYRILCHPLKRQLPSNRFRVEQSSTKSRAYEEQSSTRAARFQLNPRDADRWYEKFDDPPFTLLDQLMSEIPGKDNYQGNLTDEAFGMPAHTIDPKKSGKINAGYYHRWFKDQNLFVAMNTQPRVAGMTLETCKSYWKPKCKKLTQKFSYAIPLEIIYMTPLNRWNPFELEYKGSERDKLGKTVFEGGRNGGRTPDKAYNGTNSKKYYQTPSAFFSGQEVSTDAADTTQGSVGVLDKNGAVRVTRASGTRIFFPPISGVGVLRQRYPIVPVHGEGSAVWKELEAIKDLLMKSLSVNITA
ncbi:uncharacterized protein LOC144651043 [Oculina patagonica]